MRKVNGTGRVRRMWFLLLSLGLTALVPGQAVALTFFVNQATGSDARTCVEARNQNTPRATISAGINCTNNGDTVVVGPGLYTETADLRRPNTTLRAEPALGATIDPPAGQGVLVQGLAGVTVEGLIVKGATTGISFRDDDGVSSDFGAIRGNVVYNCGDGISVADSSFVVVENNIVHSNTGDGISYEGGTNGSIVNNLSYANGDRGIAVETANAASAYRIESNTIDDNGNGIRVEFSGGGAVQGAVADIVNNIATNNTLFGVRVRNLANLFENFNNAQGNGTADFDLSGSNQAVAGANSTSLPPAFVNPAGVDGIRGGDNWLDDSYHLSQVAAGQAVTSALVNRGALGRDGLPVVIAGSTATDGFPDGAAGDAVDMGFHYPGVAVDMEIILTRVITSLANKRGESVANHRIQADFTPGPGSDGLNLPMERVRVEINSFSQTLPPGSCDARPNGLVICRGRPPGIVMVKVDLNKNTVDIITRDVSIPLPSASTPLLPNVGFGLFLGNDIGRAEAYYTIGTLHAP